MAFARTFFLLIFISSLLPASAQSEESAVPYIPPEESPFFIVDDPNKEKRPGQRGEPKRSLREGFPRNKDAERSAGQMFTGFFTDMFASVQLGATEAEKSGAKLAIDPKTFSLDDRREFTVNFTVFNKTNRLLKLEFPTTQRIEIVVRDPAGAVIEKWSDDRAFSDQSGVVMINPDERIEYNEKMATREMIPGTTYTVEASLANNPEFTRSTQVTPTGTRDLPPAPVPGQEEQSADGQPASDEPQPAGEG